MFLSTKLPSLKSLTVEDVRLFLAEFPAVKAQCPDLKLWTLLSTQVRDQLQYIHSTDVVDAADDAVIASLNAATRPRTRTKAKELLEATKFPTITQGRWQVALSTYTARFKSNWDNFIGFTPVPLKPMKPEEGAEEDTVAAYDAALLDHDLKKKVRKRLDRDAVRSFANGLPTRLVGLSNPIQDAIQFEGLETVKGLLTRLPTFIADMDRFEHEAQDRNYSYHETPTLVQSNPAPASTPIVQTSSTGQSSTGQGQVRTAPANKLKPKTNDVDPNGTVPPSFCKRCGPNKQGASHWREQCPQNPAPEQTDAAQPRRSERLAAKGGKPEVAQNLAGGGGPLLKTRVVLEGPTMSAEIEATLDPGASISCVSADIVERLNLKVAAGDAVLNADNQPLLDNRRAVVDRWVVHGLEAWPVALKSCQVAILSGPNRVLLGADILTALGRMGPGYIDVRLAETSVDAPAAGLDPHPLDVVCHVGEQIGCVDPDFPLAAEAEKVMKEYAATFAPPDGTGADIGEATIAIDPDAALPNHKPRPFRRDVLPEAQERLDDLKGRGMARDAYGPVASAAFPVPKGDDFRLVGDYRDLNEATIPDRHPVPDCRRLIADLPAFKYWWQADLAEAYHQMRMAENSIYLTAIVIPGRFIEYLVAPFGPKNIPAQFARAVGQALAPLTKEGTVNYFDDVAGGGETPEACLKSFTNFLTLCAKRNIRLKPTKTYMGTLSLEILGVVITETTKAIAPRRIMDILAIPEPSDLSVLRSFVGVVNYVAEHVENCQRLLAPLYSLTKKDVPFIWDQPQREAFETVKTILASDTVLVRPDLTRAWTLETDASLDGVGGVLFQTAEDGSRRVVSYFSCTFNATQRAWPTYDQELFGIVYCITRADLRPLFLAHPDLTIRTDHRNLIFLRAKAPSSRKLQRYLFTLQEYEFTIEHVAGVDNAAADYLSRHFAKEESVSLVETRESFMARVRAAQEATSDSERDTWTRDPDGTYRYNGLIAIPTGDLELQSAILADAHRHHGGRDATMAALRELGFTWRAAGHAVATFVTNCAVCAKTRLSAFVKTHLATTMQPRPFACVAMDTIGPVAADSANNRYVFVFTDMFTRFTELVPAPANNAINAAHALWASVFCRHGLPERLLSDNGPEYSNRLLAALNERLDRTHHKTIPYRPQSNGLVERRNQEIKRHLRALCAEFDGFNTWSTIALPYVQWILNTTVHSVTGFDPFTLLYGGHARDRRFALEGVETPIPNDPLSSWDDYVKTLTTSLESHAKTALAAQDRVTESRSVEPTSLAAGDIVFLQNQRTTKLHGHLGPFKVLAVGDNYATTIVPLLGGDPRVVHAAQLILLPDPWLPVAELAALQAGDQEEYFVEQIIRRLPNDQVMVKWVGFDVATPEPWANVAHTPAGRAFAEGMDGQDVAV